MVFHRKPKNFIRQFAAVHVFQEMKVKDFSPVVETHITHLKIVSKYKKIRKISSHNWGKVFDEVSGGRI
jgi:hypothetical protein